MHPRFSLCLLASLWLTLAASVAAEPSGCADLNGIAETPSVDFTTQIQPLLNGCVMCHGVTPAAGLDLRAEHAYANLVGENATSIPSRKRVEPFNAKESLLKLVTNCEQPPAPLFQMPPELPESDRALIRDWINQGAWAEPTTPGIPAGTALVPVFPPGTFAGALGLADAGDGSGRLFIVLQGGQVTAVDPDGTTSDFIDLSGRLSTGGERGLLGLAFHPDFASNGRFFVNYTAGNNHPSGASRGDTVISEFSIDGSGNGDPGSERVLMTVVQDFANHNGGNIKFGPDNYLYIGMGDGGSGGDPCDRAQTLDPDDIVVGGSCRNHPSAALLGKMLRIDVNATTPEGTNNLCGGNPDGSAEYAIPADNPWADDAGICAETWSYGLRNPWRWSFDRISGDMWIADVGQARWEEINLEPANHPGGADYGWKLCEGSYTYPPVTPAQQCAHEHHFPVLEYANTGFSGDCSVTGGYRYRGPLQELEGIYIYGDYCSGKVWFGFQVGPNTFEALEFGHDLSIDDLRSFGEDEHGHVYLISNGGVWRFSVDQVFMDRFEE